MLNGRDTILSLSVFLSFFLFLICFYLYSVPCVAEEIYAWKSGRNN